MVECLQERYLQPGHRTLRHCYDYFLSRLAELWNEDPGLRRAVPPSLLTFARVLRCHLSGAQIIAARFPRKRSNRWKYPSVVNGTS